METEQERTENLAQLIIRIKDTYKVSDSEIARRIEASPATVNAWVHGKRGGGRGPNRETLRKLAAEFPKITEAEVFAAAGRRTPGPVSPDGEERIVNLYRDLTAEQQRIIETQMRAVVEDNRTSK